VGRFESTIPKNEGQARLGQERAAALMPLPSLNDAAAGNETKLITGHRDRHTTEADRLVFHLKSFLKMVEEWFRSNSPDDEGLSRQDR
jgi:hypothetical protein